MGACGHAGSCVGRQASEGGIGKDKPGQKEKNRGWASPTSSVASP